MSEATSEIVAPPPGGRAGQAYLLFVVSLLLVLSIGSIVQIWSLMVGLVLTEILLILLPAVVYVRLKGLSVADALGWRTISTGTAVAAFVLGASAWGVAVCLALLSNWVLGEGPVLTELVPKSWAALPLHLLCVAILPGICEESLFRGAILGTLRRRGTKRAVIYTAILFALYHGNPWILVSAVFLGLLFGMLAVRTGSGLTAMIAHAANNSMAVVFGFLLQDRPDADGYWVVGLLAALFVVALPLYLVRSRPSESPLPRLSTVPAGLPRWAGWTVAALTLVLLSVPVTALAFIGTYVMADDKLEPRIHRGDRIVVLRSGLVDLKIAPGDVIVFRRDGKTHIRRVVRTTGDEVWVADDRQETAVARSQIEGKMISRLEKKDAQP